MRQKRALLAKVQSSCFLQSKAALLVYTDRQTGTGTTFTYFFYFFYFALVHSVALIFCQNAFFLAIDWKIACLLSLF